MIKKSLLAIAILANGNNLFAYTYTFYNATNKSVWIDPYWDRLSFANAQMFQGNRPGMEFDPNKSDWSDISANRIKGPIQLLPNMLYIFSFSAWWNRGLCFDHIFLGWSANNRTKADVKIKESDQFNRIMAAATSFTQTIASSADTIDHAVASFDVSALVTETIVGTSGDIVEGLVGEIIELIEISQCGDLDFLIATDQGVLVAIIQK